MNITHNRSMQILHEQFYNAVHWNAASSLWYQTILVIHQIILFYHIPAQTYGLIGTLFSFLYLAIPLLNFGFDKSLPSLYATYSTNRYYFNRFVIGQLIFQVILLLCISALVIHWHEEISTWLAANLQCCFLTKLQWTLLGSVLITESIRKSLKTIAQLAFLNKQVSLIEMGSVLIYVLLFWLGYRMDIDLITIPFAALLVESSINALCLAGLVTYWYKKILNHELPSDHHLSWFVIIRNRITIYVNHLSKQLLTSNCMVSIFAFCFGLLWVSTIKLANSIAAFLLSFFDRTFGITSASLLSRLKFDNLQHKQENFSLALRPFYKVFALITGISLITMVVFIMLSRYGFAVIAWLTGYLFIVLTLIDTLFIPQEQLLLVEEKITYLLFINLLSAGFMYFLALVSSVSILILLFVFLVIRLIGFILLNRVIYHKLGISAYK